MTEADWLAATDTMMMFEFLDGRSSDRKLWLFVVAGARRRWSFLSDARSREAVEAVELYADGAIDKRELDRAAAQALSITGTRYDQFVQRMARASLRNAVLEADYYAGVDAAVSIVRDLFGNPFRPVAIDLAWLAWNGGTVGRLAEAAYTERELPSGHLALARLALVADALEDAGCSDAEILGHLRSAGPHVRGCWPLDLALGKE